MNTTMHATNSSRYPVPELAHLPDDIRAKILEVQDKAGFLPNVFLSLARRAAEWRALWQAWGCQLARHHHQRSQPLPVLRGGTRRNFAHL